MELVVIRRRDTHDATTGELYIGGTLFSVTLEDRYRDLGKKVYGETRIPAGRYPVTIRKEGGKYNRYKKRYGTDGMLWVKDVPDFKYVYIHVGNTEDDTLGCILVGESVVLSAKYGGLEQRIINSTSIYKPLHAIVSKAAAYEDVWLTVIDE